MGSSVTAVVGLRKGARVSASRAFRVLTVCAAILETACQIPSCPHTAFVSDVARSEDLVTPLLHSTRLEVMARDLLQEQVVGNKFYPGGVKPGAKDANVVVLGSQNGAWEKLKTERADVVAVRSPVCQHTRSGFAQAWLAMGRKSFLAC